SRSGRTSGESRHDRARERRRPRAEPAGDRVPRVCAALPGEALMTGAAWLQLVALLVLLAISTPILGSYMAKVYGGGEAPGDRIFGPIERVIYRVCGVDPETEQRWTTYALSLLA